jgi:hypothetical protein
MRFKTAIVIPSRKKIGPASAAPRSIIVSDFWNPNWR